MIAVGVGRTLHVSERILTGEVLVPSTSAWMTGKPAICVLGGHLLHRLGLLGVELAKLLERVLRLLLNRLGGGERLARGRSKDVIEVSCRVGLRGENAHEVVLNLILL